MNTVIKSWLINPTPKRVKTLIKEIINTLPLTMNVKIAEIPLNVADLTTIKPGDILPIAMPDTFPVYIGKSELFNALIVEDKDKLFCPS